jgi:hypothetical protein
MRFCLRPARLPLYAAACSLITALSAQTPANQRSPPRPTPPIPTQTFTRAAQPGGVAISPDGATIAWTLRGREGAAVHLTEVANPSNDKLIKLEGAATAPSAIRSGRPTAPPSPSCPTAPATNRSPTRSRSSSGPKPSGDTSNSPTSPARSPSPPGLLTASPSPSSS